MHKRNGVRAALRGKRVAVAVAAAFVPLGEAYSLPTGENVVHGTVQVTRPTAETMQINQATQKGIVNWQGFSIGSSEHVNITQPNSSSSLLNRVVGNDPSSIFGRLTANGQVFLVNNAGVFFAPGASVDVGALVASTLSITDQNFINGIYVFENSGNAGSVVNQGSISSILTAGGFTALIGPQVRNDGVIIANAGKIALGAGNRVSLDLTGDGLISISVDVAAFNASVINTGTLQADGGTVFLKASSANALLDTVINTSGIIRAHALVERNGEIVLDGGSAGAVQVAGTVDAAGGSISINADGALNVGSTVCCSPTQVVSGSQSIEAGAITVGGGATVITTPGTGSQTVTTPGTLLVRGGVLSGNVGLFHNGTGEQRVDAGNMELRGGTGTNTAAFVNSNAGGDQVVTVTGGLTISGGASGTGNRAGMVSSGNQTINGNPDIVLTGGAGGGAGNASNNVFVQAIGPDTTQQTINARTIQIRAGTGTDASATFNAARQVVNTLGNVSIFGSGGPGGSNGARIGGIGGTTLGPTNLTLNVGGNLLLRGGTVNGASLGSSGASPQANTIIVNAVGDVTLESQGAGARIGTGNPPPPTPLPSADISVIAGGNLVLGGGTTVRGNGPITLTANSLTNAGTITNGGGAANANMIFIADAFSLAGGTITAGNAGVFLRPRTGTNSFGIEAAGQTTLTNADIASVNTANFLVFGSGTGTNFTGNIVFGENAQVNGGAKNLAFIRSLSPGGTVTIGAHGLTTAGDVIVSAGGGSIASNGGTVVGDELQMRATQGIGTPGARVHTDANALTLGTGGSAFVSEANDVTLRNIVLNVGGNTALNTTTTSTGGVLDLNVVGALNVTAAGTLDATVTSGGGQTITAQSLNISAQDGRLATIVNNGVNQTVSATAGDMNLQVPGGFGVAQIVSNASVGDQTVNVAGQLNVLGGVISPVGSRNSGIFKNSTIGTQTVRASGITLRGANTGNTAGALISSQGNQLFDVTGGNINLFGGDGGVSNNATIAGGAGGQQTILAHDINLSNGFGGTDTVATIIGGNQTITATGNVTLTAQGALMSPGAAALPGVRIGGLGGTSSTATNLTLLVGGNLTLQGGSAANNGANIGSTGAGSPQPNTIGIDVGGSVILNSGSGENGHARIGSSLNNGLAAGNITITADGAIELNGTGASTSIRTLGNVTLGAASISEQGNGFILANALTTTTGGATNLSGPNQVSSYSGTSGGNLTLNNQSNLTVTGSVTSAGVMDMNVAGHLTLSGSGAADALLRSSGGQTITAHSVNLTAQDGRRANIENVGGNQTVSATAGDMSLQVPSAFGVAQIVNTAPGGNQTISVAGQLNVLGGVISPTGSRNSGIFKNGPGGLQSVSAAGITLQGGSSGTSAGAQISSQSDQFINVTGGNINLLGGNGGITNNAALVASSVGQQTVLAHDINLSNGFGGVDTVAAIVGGNQTINATGNVTLTSQGALLGTAPGGPGVRIGAPGGSTTGTNLNMTVGGNLTLNGGSAVENGAAIGSSGAGTPQQNTILIDAGGSVTLNAGDLQNTGVRIGSGSSGTAAGNITILADGGIALNGTARSAAIRTADNVTLQAASISEQGNGFILANALTTTTGGATNLSGPNQVSSYSGTSGGNLTLNNQSNLTVTGSVTSAGVMDMNVAGHLTLSGSGAADALLRSSGGQTITAQSITQTAQNGRRANIENVGGNQTVSATAGDLQLQVPGGFGVAQIINTAPGGNQTITASGQLNVLGGANTSGSTNSGIFKNGAGGLQSVRASGITLQGANSGTRAGALISSQGDQLVDVTGGTINIFGGNGGSINNAAILASAAGQQTVRAHDINLANGFGGIDTVAAIQAGHQLIEATGNVTLTSQGAILGAAAGGPGVRIGAPQNTPAGSDITLRLGGNLTINGGSVAENGAAIGSSGAGVAAPNTITIEAGGSVVLNAGTELNTGVRIGSGSNGTAGGNISIQAAGSIELNGTQRSAAIRTTDNVSLQAASISEQGSGFILANTLSTTSTGDTILGGPNQVANFNGSAGGNLVLNNAGPLTVMGLSAFNAALANQGDVTIGGFWNSFGGTAITTTGAGSDLTVTNNVTSTGTMNLSVAGDIAVTAGGVQDAALRSFGGQSIDARSLAVTSNDGRFVAVSNTGPAGQAINLTGGTGLDVQTLSPGGFASIDSSGNQTISVVDGDHINVRGASGAAVISNFGGTQTISITGVGANAITLGAPGAVGPSQVFGGVQNITAGAGGEAGSITIVGGNGNATFTGISSGQVIGGTQTVSTSGTLRIVGGNAPNQPPSGFATGLFHNGSGQQTVNAANLEMQGGSSGLNNLAIVISSGGGGTIAAGNQVVNVGGSLELAGGSGGGNNTAIIVSFADQAVNAGSAELTGGNGGANNGAFINIAGAGPAGSQSLNITGDLSVAGGAGGNAGITGSANLQQTIFADNISLTNSAGGGTNSVGFILGGHQAINATGDVTLTARASGGDLPGVRIGGLAGAAPTATDLTLTVGGDLVLTGGTAVNNGVGIGSTAALGVPPLANNITISAGGDVVLNSGVPGSGARIGSPQTGAGPGSISITAGGDIRLNGVDEFATVRTQGTVTLSAADITESVRGRVIAGTLNTLTTGDALLTGPNEVSTFSASAGGDVTFNNTGALNVVGMSVFDDVTITNVGNVTVSGPWIAGGTSTITVGSDILLQSTMQSQDVVLTSNTGAVLQDPGATIVAETLSASAVNDVHLDGTNTVETIDVKSTEGDVSFRTSSPLLTLSKISLPGELLVNHTGAVLVSGHVEALSHDITATGNITVGGADAQGATLLYAPGHIFITTPQSIIVRGSDTTPGALSSVVAGGALRFNAADVTIGGGGALATPALVRGASVDMSVGRLNVTGGRGHLSPAWLLSGSDINLTVGDAVRLQAGSGLASWAKVQTETRDGVIRMTFPTLSGGGFYVNGDEGDVKHGQTGFYTQLKPVKIGDTLILEYGAP